MKIFLDIFTNEEIIVDSYTFKNKFNDCIGEIQSQYIQVGGSIDVGGGNHFGGGGDDEQVDDMTEKKLNILTAYNYQETSFGQKDYISYIKGYMKRIKVHLESKNPDRVKGFMLGATEAMKWIVKNFDEFTFYIPQTYDADNHIVLSYYEEGAETPVFLYWMDGLLGKAV